MSKSFAHLDIASTLVKREIASSYQQRVDIADSVKHVRRRDPNCIMGSTEELILQLITNSLFPILVAAIVAFIVASIFGEMAATKYAQKEARRRDHHMHLTQGGTTKSFLYNYGDTSLKLNESKGEYSTYRARDPDDLDDRDLSNLVAHLKTGYPEIYKSIKHHSSNYNKMVDKLIDIGSLTESRLRESLQGFIESKDVVHYQSTYPPFLL